LIWWYGTYFEKISKEPAVIIAKRSSLQNRETETELPDKKNMHDITSKDADIDSIENAY
jgi:hypothetical protein